jgi:hypothetical protein
LKKIKNEESASDSADEDMFKKAKGETQAEEQERLKAEFKK